MSKLLFVVLGLSWAHVAPAVNYTNIALLAKGRLSEQFVREVPLPEAKGARKVIYGNNVYGYWEQDHDGSEEFTFLPPGYRHPLKFFRADADGKLSAINSPSLTPPDLTLFTAYSGIETQNHTLRTPFVALSLALPSIEDGALRKKFSHVAVIFNRTGEIIWLHVPQKGKYLTEKALSIKQLDPTRLAIMADFETSLLEVVDTTGLVHATVHGKSAIRPFVMGPDFALSPDLKQLTFISHKKGYIRSPSHLWQAPRAYLGSTIASYNWDRGISEETHNSFMLFNPLTNATAEKEDRQFYLWQNKPIDRRISEYSSFQETDEGYLVAERVSNQVLMLHKGSRQILWSFQLTGKQRPQYVPDLGKKARLRCVREDQQGNLLIMASSPSTSHLLRINPKQEKLHWHVPVHNEFHRRSLGCLEAGASPEVSLALLNEDRRGHGRIIEVSAQAPESIWQFSGLGKTGRITPLQQFGSGRYLGMKLPDTY